jgi:hypothetical protein
MPQRFVNILDNNIELIRSVIDQQYNDISYQSLNFTIKHKQLVYVSFKNLLQKYPDQMEQYLLFKSRTGGFQHKIFQEYISLLEKSFPFFILKNKKMIKISSLLDDNLSLFDGISHFDAKTDLKSEIKNNTQEIYIGNRKSSYIKPFYIGKLLDVKIQNNSIMDKVVEYSFSKIKLKDINPNTSVKVSHLRVPPHYQMGGMVYVNRIRKKISDQSLHLMT